MAKLDRLGWAAGLAFTAYGRAIGVRVTRADVMDQVAVHLPYGWKPAPSSTVDHLYSLVVGGGDVSSAIRKLHLVYAGPYQVARARVLDEALEAFESDVQLSVAATARGRLFVHAGVVAWRGRAILLPGRSFRGKSTLVAALVRAGATYYSDEYAVLDDRGRVHPYARPLSLRREGGLGAERLPVKALGGTAGEHPLPVGLVVVTHYRSGAQWRPRRLSPGQATLALLNETVAARSRPVTALRTLHRVAAGAVTFRGVRGEAEESAPLILKACDREAGGGSRAEQPSALEVAV